MITLLIVAFIIALSTPPSIPCDGVNCKINHFSKESYENNITIP